MIRQRSPNTSSTSAAVTMSAGRPCATIRPRFKAIRWVAVEVVQDGDERTPVLFAQVRAQQDPPEHPIRAAAGSAESVLDGNRCWDRAPPVINKRPPP